MREFTRFIGLDVHKDTVCMAAVRRYEPELAFTEIPYETQPAKAVIRALKLANATMSEVLCCYE